MLEDVLAVLADAPGDPLQDQFRHEFRMELVAQRSQLKTSGRGRKPARARATELLPVEEV